MGQLLETRLHRLMVPETAGLVRGGLRGVERECLRITPDGRLARTPHPQAIGSALTNLHITTDYSEALLEFVTPPQLTNWETIQFLCDLHQFVMERIDDELIWPLSMPCAISSDADVPLAQYGSSHIGRMKTIYRRGLGHRYGRIMQAISGIHYNYSLPDSFWPVYQELEGQPGELQEFRSASYLAAVRNVRRLGWLVLYLFGASPALCKSFVRGRGPTDLQELDGGTLYGPFATSLRMSDLGYRNSAQANLVVSANSLDEYVEDLFRATHIPRPEFEKIGVKVDGDYRQLNANQLQIENEYYSTVRPKRVTETGERPTAALLRGGVQYLELRTLDISPWDPVGISQRTMRFLEVFLIYCLLEESPPISAAETECIGHNLGLVAHRGREPGLKLAQCGGSVPLKDWAVKICREMVQVARLIDPGELKGHVAAVHHQLQAVEDAERTPSASLLRELRGSGQSLAEFGLDLAGRTRDYFLSLAPELNRHRDLLSAEAKASLIRQQRIEAADDEPFEEYLARYLA
ncbi:MAG: glutamate--cysteine ligase [Chromatiales bacterium]|nr:MAG: glutamate--cysteine ligase [Chromatiales bacterium]